MDEQLSPAPPAPRKRAWFQLHLSTCVVLMLAAGVLVWANVRREYRPNRLYATTERGPIFADVKCGWPYAVNKGVIVNEADPALEEDAKNVQLGLGFKGWEPLELGGKWQIAGILKNALIAVIVLSVIAVVCEWLIRRRRKSETSA